MLHTDLFGSVSPQDITTQGIKYAGAKTRLIAPILNMIAKVRPRRVLDGFAGTTRVSQALAQAGYQVLVNDTAIWTKTFAECYLKAHRSDAHYQGIIDHLNAVPPRHGWFSEHYGGEVVAGRLSKGQDGLKKPFQMPNANRLDGIRDEIDRLALAHDERQVALTSLILALERVDSTLGHYVSYLKAWSPRSFNTLQLELPRLIRSDQQHEVFNEDAVGLTAKVQADVAYFDPPYGSNNEKMPPSRVRYASYYHLWKTIILNDQPRLVGAARRREDCADTAGGSAFEEFRRSTSGRFMVIEAIERLILNTISPCVVLSYSSGGRATATELTDILARNGTIIDVVRIAHRRHVMSHMKWTNDWLRDGDGENFEYLFLLQKKPHKQTTNASPRLTTS